MPPKIFAFLRLSHSALEGVPEDGEEPAALLSASRGSDDPMMSPTSHSPVKRSMTAEDGSLVLGSHRPAPFLMPPSGRPLWAPRRSATLSQQNSQSSLPCDFEDSNEELSPPRCPVLPEPVAHMLRPTPPPVRPGTTAMSNLHGRHNSPTSPPVKRTARYTPQPPPPPCQTTAPRNPRPPQSSVGGSQRFPGDLPTLSCGPRGALVPFTSPRAPPCPMPPPMEVLEGAEEQP
eukprot:GGOE01009191.1.p1 GENE.GGOE01009191.1~~GGOE01009191.1.p1  ORF type:complete len:240 (-),score=16.66 GGOE01009191.1:1243-1938(-)